MMYQYLSISGNVGFFSNISIFFQILQILLILVVSFFLVSHIWNCFNRSARYESRGQFCYIFVSFLVVDMYWEGLTLSDHFKLSNGLNSKTLSLCSYLTLFLCAYTHYGYLVISGRHKVFTGYRILWPASPLQGEMFALCNRSPLLALGFQYICLQSLASSASPHAQCPDFICWPCPPFCCVNHSAPQGFLNHEVGLLSSMHIIARVKLKT